MSVEKVLDIARREIGTPEGQASRYRDSIGTDPDTPWCVPFVAYCLKEALGYQPLYLPNHCSARLRRWARRRRFIRTEPEPGDIFLHTFSCGGIKVVRTCWHVGLVEEVHGSEWWGGIEGNGIVRLGEQNRVKRCRHRTPYYQTLFLRWTEIPMPQRRGE